MYTAISREVVGKNVHATISKGNMGYDQYTVFLILQLSNLLFLLSFSTHRYTPMAFLIGIELFASSAYS